MWLMIVVVLNLVCWILLLTLRRRIRSNIPSLVSSAVSPETPYSVSVIVPARNEEATIGRCLDSLLSQRGVTLETIVVDDESTDRTAEVLNRYIERGVKVLKTGGTPDGWTGKNWACHIGYMHSTGDWLLFTDADATFSEKTLSTAISAALPERVEFMTVFPRFDMNTPSLRAVLPILLLALYLFGRPDRMNTGKVRRAREGFAFGSFVLVRRDTYDRMGGHLSIRDSVVEDRALAARAFQVGARTRFADGAELVRAAWNTGLPSLWQGMTRLLTVLFVGRVAKSISYVATLLFMLLPPFLPSAIFMLSRSVTGVWAELTVSLLCLCLATTSSLLETRRNGSKLWGAALWPAGGVIILFAMIRALAGAILRPRFTWRGRVYEVRPGEELEQAVIVSQQ